MDYARRALKAFDARAFAVKHGGCKETQSTYTFEYLLPCPFCASSRLRWNHPVKQAWVCWGCRKSGDTLDLVSLLEHCNRDRALEVVEANYHGGDVDLHLQDAELPSVAQHMQVQRWPHGVELLAPHHTQAWRYLESRGVTHEMIAPWRVGYGRAGWLENYLVFPCFWRGNLAYWQGRIARDVGVDERRIKSRNPTSRGTGCWSAQSVVMAGDLTPAAEHVVIVEGPFDAIKVGRNAIALLGKSVTPAKISWIVGLGAGAYTVYLDSDAQGAALDVARRLAAYAPTYLAQPPPDHDPGDLTPEQNAACIAQARRVSAHQLA